MQIAENKIIVGGGVGGSATSDDTFLLLVEEVLSWIKIKPAVRGQSWLDGPMATNGQVILQFRGLGELKPLENNTVRSSASLRRQQGDLLVSNLERCLPCQVCRNVGCERALMMKRCVLIM